MRRRSLDGPRESRAAARQALLLRILALFLIALAIGRCGDDNGPTGPPRGEGRIGTDGGTLRSDDDDAQVIVPQGALGASTLLTVRKLDPAEVPAALKARTVVSGVYLFGPEGLTFQTPVRVEIFFDADLLPSGVELEDLTIGKVNAAGQIEELSNVQIIPPSPDRVSLQVTRRGIGGQISSFSPFAVFVRSPAGGTAPIVTAVTFPATISNDPGSIATGTVGFQDPDGDIDRVFIEEVSDPNDANTPGDFDPGIGGQTEGTFQIVHQCVGPAPCNTGPVTVAVVLEDAAGHRSAPFPFSFEVVE